MKRLGIYFFFDKDGIVDKYVDYVLEDLTKHVDKLIVVCNGQLNERGRKTFENYNKNSSFSKVGQILYTPVFSLR